MSSRELTTHHESNKLATKAHLNYNINIFDENITAYILLYELSNMSIDNENNDSDIVK